MTESIELLLGIYLWIAFAILVAIWIWEAKYNNRFKCRYVKFFIYTALAAIEVEVLIVHYLTGKKYGFDLLSTFLWLVCMVLSALNTRK